MRLTSVLIYGSCVICLTALVLLCFNPGYMNADTLDMWGQASHMVPYQDWHPVLISVLWSQMRHVYSGPQSLLLVEDVFFLVGVILMLRGVAGRWKTIVLTTAILLFPPVFAYLGTIGKDSLLSAALILTVGLLYLYMEIRKQWVVALALGASFIAFSTRQNAVFGLLPVLGFLFWEVLVARSSRALWSAALVLTTITSFIAINATVKIVVRPVPAYEYQAIPLYDLAALSAATHRVLLPPEFLSPSGSLARISEHVDPKFVNTLIWPWSPANPLRLSKDPRSVHALTRLWINNICAHPLLYLRWRWRVLAALAGLDPVVTTPYLDGVGPNPGGITLRRTPFTSGEQELLHHIGQSLFFRAYVYVLLLTLILGWSIWKRSRLNAIVAASGLTFFFAFFVISVNSEFRLDCYTVFVAVALSVRWLAESVPMLMNWKKHWKSLPMVLTAPETTLTAGERNR